MVESPDHSAIMTTIPPGFSILEGRGTYPVLVPTYLVPATEMAIQVERVTKEFMVDEAEPGVSMYVFK